MTHREVHSSVAGTALDEDLRAIFLRTCEQDIAGLERARQHHGKTAFLRRLHKIKGALLMLGENALVETLGALQARVDDAGLAGASDLHANFLQCVATLAQRYRDDLGQAERHA
ncbi:MAG: Hpt domain-containing protein [Burkholderiales bacterium]|nr:Hpt domain-containing protein [Burkholderiales bacterium]MDE2288963.1 Hpt domain-containing protein [Burkholderiales bacterium]MDE2608222.1 Hpt domain-containing protein [Burkholderiales bacterium]